MPTINLHLLNNRQIKVEKDGIGLGYENSYRVIAGEENATIFEIVSKPTDYENAIYTVEMVNSQGYGIDETTIANNQFTLPKGMAVAGYSQILIRAKKNDEVLPFMPLKIKVWNTIDNWQEYVPDVQDEIEELQNAVDSIESKIMSGTTTENPLANKEYVDEAVGGGGHTWYRYSNPLTRRYGGVMTMTDSQTSPSNFYNIYNPQERDGNLIASHPSVGDIIFSTHGEIGVIIDKEDTGNYYYYAIKTTWISNQEWTCLEKGTLITMADGTKKPIEKVKRGDILLSYNPITKQQTQAVCLVSMPTVDEPNTDYYVFEDGRYLGICLEGHQIYNPDKETWVQFHGEVTEGDKFLDENNNKIEYVGKWDNLSTKGISLKRFYNIISSNNMYYANGILLAHNPYDKENWITNYVYEMIPDALKEIFEQDAEEEKLFDFLINDKEFVRKSISYFADMRKKERRIKELKQSLDDTDYVAIKASENTSATDEQMKAQRQAWRDEINTLEQSLIQDDYTYHGKLMSEAAHLDGNILHAPTLVRRSYFFKRACARDNANYALFKQNYSKNNF